MSLSKNEKIANKVWDFLSANEAYRRLADLASRGIGQPLSSKPDLQQLSMHWLSESSVSHFAELLSYVAEDKDAQEGIPETSRSRLKQLADELETLAAAMVEWESYEPYERRQLEDEIRGTIQDPGTGYSDEAARTLNKVSGVCREAARLLRKKWPYDGEDPVLGREF